MPPSHSPESTSPSPPHRWVPVLLLCLPLILLAACGGRGGDAKSSSLKGASDPEPLILTAPDEPSRLAREVYFDPNDTLIPLTREVLEVLDPDTNFSLGLDRMVRSNFSRLDNRRVAVVTSRLAIDSEGVHLLESLLPQSKPIVSRVILFADENPGGARSRTLNRVIGAYPAVRVFERSHVSFRLTPAMLDDADILLIDLPLRGASFYPEVGFLAHVLQEASVRGIRVVVLDRPHLINGNISEGPAGDPGLHGQITSYFPDLLVMGLTTGELARFYNNEFGMNLNLEVVDILHWARTDGMTPLWETWDRIGINPGSGEMPELVQYYPHHPREAQLRLVADLLPKGKTEVVAEGEESSLLLDPSPLEAAEFIVRVSDLGPIEGSLTVASAEGGDRVQLRTSGLLNEPVFTSVVLWAVYAGAYPSLLPEEGTPANYGTGMVVEMLRQGRGPREIRRTWQSNPKVSEMTTRRSRILRQP